MVIRETRRLLFMRTGKQLLKSVAGHRHKLIINGDNELNTARCLNIIGNITKHLNFRMLDNSKSLSIYFIDHQDNIRYLIGDNDKRRLEQLDDLLIQASFYKNL